MAENRSRDLDTLCLILSVFRPVLSQFFVNSFRIEIGLLVFIFLFSYFVGGVLCRQLFVRRSGLSWTEEMM